MSSGRQAPPDNFRLIFGTVLFLTVLCLVVSAGLAVLVPAQTEQVKNVSNATLTIFQAGAGALFGLLAGKGAR